eukprot:g2885.t1
MKMLLRRAGQQQQRQFFGTAARHEGLKLQSVVVFCKRSRLETEIENIGYTWKDVEEKKGEIKEYLQSVGLPYELLLRSFHNHSNAVAGVLSSLAARGVDVCVDKTARTDAPSKETIERINECDCVITVGGDGMFLKAASIIQRGFKVPFLGINTDPETSTGALCSWSWGTCGRNFDQLLTDLMDPTNFRVRAHSRIGIERPGKETIFALNEVFFGERHPGLLTNVRMMLHDDKNSSISDRYLCSGVIAASGTGTTAWLANSARVTAQTVEDVLETAGVSANAELVERVEAELNNRMRLPYDSKLMHVFNREVVHSPLHPPPKIGREARAMSLAMEAIGWDNILIVDGMRTYDMDRGSQVEMAIDREAAIYSIEI